ncbi:MAG TPA: hypothetical protein VK420_20805, partial [Longimicrobium sp.]|nr:hypothetical protein [Longimicrobium sp.]
LELRGKLDALLDEEHRQGNRPTPETLRKAVKRWPGLLPDVARGREAARAAAAQATFAYGLRELLARFLVWYLGLRQRLGRQLRGPAVPKMGEPAGSPRLARHIMPDSPVQNPMVHVAGLPPDGKKLEKARKRIKAVNLRMSRYLVGLNRVSSIHCARWVEFKTEGGENRLLFLSNYDGSWDGYIDSFLDTAEINFFLREMWKHTRGFTDRAATSSGVKRWIRERLEPTPIFFSAYQARAEKPVNAAPPPPSIADIHKAVQLREALRTEGEAEDALLAHYIRTGDCPPEPSLLTLGQAISLAWAERRRAAEAKRLAAEAKRRMAQPATAPTP